MRGCARLLDEPDGEVPDDVVRAAVEVLAAWDWAGAADAVLALDSERHPLLIASLAARLAELGRLDRPGHAAVRARSVGR